MTGSSYEGPALDGTVQTLDEAPYWQDDVDAEADAVEYATPAECPGEATVENVPSPGDRPDVDGQSTLEDFGGGRA